MKIVVLDGYTLNPGDLTWTNLEQCGNVVVYNRTDPDVESIVEAIGEAEIVLTNKTVLSKEVLKRVPLVKYIGVLATGYNVVDISAAKDQGVTVTNIPNYSTNAVAQFTFALILELCHNIGEHSSAVLKGDWVSSVDFSFWNHPLIELSGKSIGLIGCGQIGQAVAKIAQAFGMSVLVYNRSEKSELISDTFQYVELDELLDNSDIISLHIPLTDKTEGIINRDTIRQMRDDVLLINTSRGPLIVEQDLTDALNSGKVAGAAVDVISAEPMSAKNPLLEAKNIIITPHIAWATKEARSRLMDIAVNNVKAFIDKKPINVVN